MKCKPDEGTVTYQPFVSGTGGSQCFRIPSLVTLPDGSLLAAADARWNHMGDGFGIDTMVSCSADGGNTWNYSFVNYLGDNGDRYHPESTAFIDPAMAVKGNTVYLLVDLYPGGIYIGNAVRGTGYDENGHLLLKRADEESCRCFLSDWTDGWAVILCRDEASGIVSEERDVWVDRWFNWYRGKPVAKETLFYGKQSGQEWESGQGTGGDQEIRPEGNLFFADSPWKVVSTSYLYLTKSEDGGRSWSAPMMLNPQVKHASESFYGVGPGRGLVTEEGRILFPCYVYDGVEGQRSSFIYSDDDGKSWKRTEDATKTIYSGESQLVELKDGRIRCFFRNNLERVCYADAWKTKQGYRWEPFVRTEITACSNCQISVIARKRSADGKQVILVSCPADAKERVHGTVFAARIGKDGEMEWCGKKEITGEAERFAYSCLTEMEDGAVGLLYEGGEWPISFEVIC